MSHYGNGDIQCVSLCSASIVNDNVIVLEKLLKKHPELAYSGDQNYHILSFAIVKNKQKCIDILLSYDADVNSIGKRDKTPLYYAIVNKNYDTFKKLIDKGAKVNSEFGRFERTSLIKFCIQNLTYAFTENLRFMAKILIEKGAVINLDEYNDIEKETISKL